MFFKAELIVTNAEGSVEASGVCERLGGTLPNCFRAVRELFEFLASPDRPSWLSLPGSFYSAVRVSPLRLDPTPERQSSALSAAK